LVDQMSVGAGSERNKILTMATAMITTTATTMAIPKTRCSMGEELPVVSCWEACCCRSRGQEYLREWPVNDKRPT
jgi:hypothetical protein